MARTEVSRRPLEELGQGFQRFRVVATAVDLRLLTLLDGRSVRVADVASLLGIRERPARILLNAHRRSGRRASSGHGASRCGPRPASAPSSRRSAEPYFFWRPWRTPCRWNQPAIVFASSSNCLFTFIMPQIPPASPVFALWSRSTAASFCG